MTIIDNGGRPGRAPVVTARPRLLVAYPGHSCRRDMTLAAHLAGLVPCLLQHFDVTLAFRRVLEPLDLPVPQLAIADGEAGAEQSPFFTPSDFRSVRGCLAELDSFAVACRDRFDFVLERPWRLDGALVAAFARQGVRGIPVLEAEFHLGRASPRRFPRTLHQRLLWPLLRRYLVRAKRRWLQDAHCVAVETRQMHDWLVRRGYLSPQAPWALAPAAYDASLFRPGERNAARDALKLNRDRLLVTYVGSMNCLIHDPVPLIRALADSRGLRPLLCMVGEGAKRHALEEMARGLGVEARFTGRLDRAAATRYIAAADVCAAPYDLDFYPDRVLTSGSLKVPEYLACGRPVLATDCGRMRDLLADGRYGILVDNTVDGYQRVLRRPGLREELAAAEGRLQADIASGRIREDGVLQDFAAVAASIRGIADLEVSRRCRESVNPCA